MPTWHTCKDSPHGSFLLGTQLSGCHFQVNDAQKKMNIIHFWVLSTPAHLEMNNSWHVSTCLREKTLRIHETDVGDSWAPGWATASSLLWTLWDKIATGALALIGWKTKWSFFFIRPAKPPRKLHAGIHLGWEMRVPPGRTLSQAKSGPKQDYWLETNTEDCPHISN